VSAPAPRSTLALLAAAAVGVQVGAAIVATRFVVGQLGPASIACVRYAIALLSLLPFIALDAARTRIATRDLLAVMLLGVGQFGLLIALLNLGLQSVPAAPAALIFASFPLLTLLVARAFGHERLSAAKLWGVALSLAGVAIALGPDVLAGCAAGGQLAVLGSALTGALCSVLYRPYLRRYPALPVSLWAMGGALLFLIVWSLFEDLPARAVLVTPGGWAALAFIGLSSGIGYFLWLWALRHAPASRVTLFVAVSPLTSIALGALWLGEAVPSRLWLALALVSAGLAAAHVAAANTMGDRP
jgi:drug/metabolite transporter (DMT)-like permease